MESTIKRTLCPMTRFTQKFIFLARTISRFRVCRVPYAIFLLLTREAKYLGASSCWIFYTSLTMKCNLSNSRVVKFTFFSISSYVDLVSFSANLRERFKIDSILLLLALEQKWYTGLQYLKLDRINDLTIVVLAFMSNISLNLMSTFI